MELLNKYQIKEIEKIIGIEFYQIDKDAVVFMKENGNDIKWFKVIFSDNKIKSIWYSNKYGYGSGSFTTHSIPTEWLIPLVNILGIF